LEKNKKNSHLLNISFRMKNIAVQKTKFKQMLPSKCKTIILYLQGLKQNNLKYLQKNETDQQIYLL